MFLPDPPFPTGIRYALASTKLSQINNGGLVSAVTDQAVAVRNGTTDELISVGSAAGENVSAVIPDNGAGALTVGVNQVTNAMAAQAGANTMKGNWTAGTANESDNAMPSCSDSGGNHLNYVAGTGVTCGTTDSHTGTVTSVGTNNGLTGGTITTTGTLGFATVATNSALCNNSGSTAVPTAANCTVTGTGNMPLASGATMTGLTLKSSGPTTPSLLLSSGAGEVGLFSAGPSGTSLALQADNGNMQTVGITGAVTLSLTSPANPTKTNYIIKQDGSGHVYSIAGCKWAGGTTITYSSTASAIDEVSVMYDGTNFYCMGGAAFQ